MLVACSDVSSQHSPVYTAVVLWWPAVYFDRKHHQDLKKFCSVPQPLWSRLVYRKFHMQCSSILCVLRTLPISLSLIFGNTDKNKTISEAVPDHAMKVHRGSWGVAQLTFSLGARWRGLVSITPRPIYPEERTFVSIGYEARCTSQLISTDWKREKSLFPDGICRPDHPDLSLVTINNYKTVSFFYI